MLYQVSEWDVLVEVVGYGMCLWTMAYSCRWILQTEPGDWAFCKKALRQGSKFALGLVFLVGGTLIGRDYVYAAAHPGRVLNTDKVNSATKADITQLLRLCPDMDSTPIGGALDVPIEGEPDAFTSLEAVLLMDSCGASASLEQTSSAWIFSPVRWLTGG